MQAVIMAGGKGTRLASLTENKIPKPMAKIAGKPLLEWQIEQFKSYGITDIILVVGHLGELIKDYFRNGDQLGIHIQYFFENEPLGSAGSLYYLKKLLLPNSPFFLVFGDLLFNVDLARMKDFHQKKSAEATIFVHPNSHPFDSDLVLKDKNDKVIGFDLKENDRSNYFYDNCVNAGLFLFNPSFCNKVIKPDKTDLVKDILMKMTNQDERLFAYSSPEYIKDIGTPERIKIAEQELINGIVEKRNLKYKQKAIFLDRDGTINIHKGLIWEDKDFELYPFAGKAIKIINRAGYLAIVITNQPVVARGLCTIEDIEKIHNKMKTLLGKEEAFLDDIRFCPHHPDKGYIGENPVYKISCQCRKPNIGLIEECVQRYHIDISQSWFIGDSSVDIRTGKNAGCKTVLVLTGESGKDSKYNDVPDVVATDLYEGIEKILDL